MIRVSVRDSVVGNRDDFAAPRPSRYRIHVELPLLGRAARLFARLNERGERVWADYGLAFGAVPKRVVR